MSDPAGAMYEVIFEVHGDLVDEVFIVCPADCTLAGAVRFADRLLRRDRQFELEIRSARVRQVGTIVVENLEAKE